jgi:hypothetical protein
MKIRIQLIAGIAVFAVILALIFVLIVVTDRQLEAIAAREGTANNIALKTGELGYISNDYILYRDTVQKKR